MRIQDLVFVGLNGRVAALESSTGEMVWEWHSPKGLGYVNLLVERNVVVAGTNGYVYGLDPKTGDQLWFNDLKGWGLGVTTLAALGGSTSQAVVLQAVAADEAASSAATSASS
jgi:outer membrane protein assembly factor BamB